MWNGLHIALWKVSSNGPCHLLQKKEETSHNSLLCGCGQLFCLVYFVLGPLIPSINLSRNFESNHRENFPDASIFLYRKCSILLVTGADELFKWACECLFICICSLITFFCLSLLRHQGVAWTIQFCSSPCSSTDFDLLKIKHLSPWIRDKKLELRVAQQRQLSRDVFSNFYFSRMSVDLMGMTAAAILTPHCLPEMTETPLDFQGLQKALFKPLNYFKSFTVFQVSSNR